MPAVDQYYGFIFSLLSPSHASPRKPAESEFTNKIDIMCSQAVGYHSKVNWAIDY